MFKIKEMKCLFIFLMFFNNNYIKFPVRWSTCTSWPISAGENEDDDIE